MAPTTAVPSAAAPPGQDILPDIPREFVEPLRARVEALAAENHRLTLRVKVLEAQLFARAVAREAVPVDPDVLSLFQDRADEWAAAPPSAGDGVLTPMVPKSVRPQPARRRTLPRQPLDPALPREVIALPDPPEKERVCPMTGVPLVPGFTQALEVLARKPAVYYVKRYERIVWVSPAKTAPMTTPWPADVLPRSGVHASIVAHIAAAHFSEHVPYYRLEQQLARTGVALPRSTQVSLMAQLDALVAPLVDHLKARVLGSGYVHLDATPIDVCDPARPGEARSATLWAYRARSRDPTMEGLVWFDYRETKSPVHPGHVLRDARYRGVADGWRGGAGHLGPAGSDHAPGVLGARAAVRPRGGAARGAAGDGVSRVDRSALPLGRRGPAARGGRAGARGPGGDVARAIQHPRNTGPLRAGDPGWADGATQECARDRVRLPAGSARLA